MKKIISYSLSGNNEKVASALAEKLEATHIKIMEIKKRTIGAIAFDMLFNRIPKTEPDIIRMDDANLIILCGPVWMGKVASPLRNILKQIKKSKVNYAFVSISGGADGPNPKLEKELQARTGETPTAVIDLHIANLLPKEPKPTRADTSTYIVTPKDVDDISSEIVSVLKKLAIT